VLKINGELVLMIPLESGGSGLVDCSRDISTVEGEYLKVVIPEPIAGMLRIEEGDLVWIHNSDGKFNIQAAKPRPVH
jgi:hypothetical protein